MSNSVTGWECWRSTVSYSTPKHDHAKIAGQSGQVNKHDQAGIEDISFFTRAARLGFTHIVLEQVQIEVATTGSISV